MLVIGADRRNYLGAEVKYHPDFIIAELDEPPFSGFLWQSSRLERTASHSSAGYQAMSSRHRGVLYNDFIERLHRGDTDAWAILDAAPTFGFPNIL